MNWILDIAVVVIVAISVFLAYKKGLIASLFSLLGTLIALVLSFVLRAPVAAWLDGMFINNAVKGFVLNTLQGTGFGNYEDSLSKLNLSEILKSVPEEFENLLKMVGVDLAEISSGVTQNTLEAKNRFIESIANPISATISSVVAFVALFVILAIACFFAAKFLTLLFNALPFTKKINKIGGAILGFLRGLLIVYVLVIAVTTVANTMGVDEKSIFSKETVSQTVLVKNIQMINPLALLFK